MLQTVPDPCAALHAQLHAIVEGCRGGTCSHVLLGGTCHHTAIWSGMNVQAAHKGSMGIRLYACLHAGLLGLTAWVVLTLCFFCLSLQVPGVLPSVPAIAGLPALGGLGAAAGLGAGLDPLGMAAAGMAAVGGMGALAASECLLGQ